MLSLEQVDAGYGASQVLFGLSFTVAAGEVVALLGRNGMGKTTTVRAITGLNPATAGEIRWDGATITHEKPYRIARRGLGLVPEGRQIFPNLSVTENLAATARAGADKALEPWTAARVFAMFPRLRERAQAMGGKLSGGEQQMLAIGRALMTNPRLLVLDEATEGLAPLVRQDIWAGLAALRQTGLAILIIDKNVDALMILADRHVIIEKGCVAWTGSSNALAGQPETRQRYLGV